MASLFEYFLKDFSRDLSIEKKWKLQDARDNSEAEVRARVYLDFHANAKYVAFYVPRFDSATFPEALLMNSLNDILEVPNNDVGVQLGFHDLPSDLMDGKDLNFAGRVFLYCEREPPEELKQRLLADRTGHTEIPSSKRAIQNHKEVARPSRFQPARIEFERAGQAN